MARGGPNISLPSTSGYTITTISKSQHPAFITSKEKKNSRRSRIEQQTTDILTLTLSVRRDMNGSSYPELSLSQKRNKWKDGACTVFWRSPHQPMYPLLLLVLDVL